MRNFRLSNEVHQWFSPNKHTTFRGLGNHICGIRDALATSNIINDSHQCFTFYFTLIFSGFYRSVTNLIFFISEPDERSDFYF